MAESNAFPWLKHLPEDAAVDFFRELWNELDDFLMDPGHAGITAEGFVKNLDPMIQAWKATAEVHADPALYQALTQPNEGGDFGEVFVPAPRPGGILAGPDPEAEVPNQRDGWHDRDRDRD